MWSITGDGQEFNSSQETDNMWIFFYVQCATGYTISKDQKQCIKCSIKDCFQCSNDGKSCLRCKEGLSFDSKTKTCSGCKVANCQTCEKDLSTCTKCLYDLRTDTSYGLVGNTCVSCAKFDKNAIACDNSKVTACKAGFYVDKTRNACPVCALPCTACEGSATYCSVCDTGYGINAVNGRCIPKGDLESDAQAPAATKSAAAYTKVVQHILGTLTLIFMMWGTMCDA